jgi:hypothetical protein
MALDAGTGREIWRAASAPVRSLVDVRAADVLVAIESDGTLAGYQPRSGKRLWTWVPGCQPTTDLTDAGPTAQMSCVAPESGGAGGAGRPLRLVFDVRSGREISRAALPMSGRAWAIQDLLVGRAGKQLVALGPGGDRRWEVAAHMIDQLRLRGRALVVADSRGDDERRWRALDPGSGRTLWSVDRPADVARVLATLGDAVSFVVARQGELEERSFARGEIVNRFPTPFSLPAPGDHGASFVNVLTARSERCVAVAVEAYTSATGRSDERGVIAAWCGHAPVVMPLPVTGQFQLIGDHLVTTADRGGSLGVVVHSLTETVPAEESLSTRERIVSVLRRRPGGAEAELAQEPATLAALREVAGDGAADPGLRTTAIQTLRRLRDPGAADVLMEILREAASATDDDLRNLRSEAARALAAIGDERAWPVLAAVLRSDDLDARDASVADEVRGAIWAAGATVTAGLCRPLPGEQPGVTTQSEVWAPGRTTGPLGTAHPVVKVKAAADGSWAALCQAREDTDGDGQVSVGVGFHGDLFGDRMEPYIVLGAGTGVPIEDFVASDPTDRHIVVRHEGCLLLVDTRAGLRLNLSLLGADPSDDPSPLGPHGAASFDRSGRHLLYRRARGAQGRPAVVVRELATGGEKEIDPGPGLLASARFDPGSAAVVMEVVVADADGNGKLEVPERPTSLSGRRCRGPITSYTTGPRQKGDTEVTRVAFDGVVREVPYFERSLGAAVVVRQNGALRLTEPSGQTVDLAPATCHASVLHADPDRGRLFWLCEEGPQQGNIWTRGGDGKARVLGSGARSSLRDSDRLHPRYVSVGEGVLDLEREVVHGLKGWPQWIAAPHVLILRERALAIVDPRTGRSVALPAADRPYLVAAAGGVVALPSLVIDVASGRVIGRPPTEPMAVTTDGRVLVPDRPDHAFGKISIGPLRWVAPSPLP